MAWAAMERTRKTAANVLARGRRWLRLSGLLFLGTAFALDIALLITGDPAALPGPLGPLAERRVLPWAEQNLVPWAVRLGLATIDEPPSPANSALAQGIPPPDGGSPSRYSNPPAFDRSAGALAITPVPFATPSAPQVAEPVRVIAPSIEVDAPVVPVGLTADGAMGTPRSAFDVGWYGPRPGEPGHYRTEPAPAPGEKFPGGAAISVPIKGYQFPAALTVLGIEYRLKPRVPELLPEIMAGAERISNSLLNSG